MYTTKELRMMFAGCETAQNIIREQIGDVDGRAVWYPWDTERIRPVTPEQIIKEVQDAWDALPLSRSVEACELVDPDELAALQRIAEEGRYELRVQYCADSAIDEEDEEGKNKL